MEIQIYFSTNTAIEALALLCVIDFTDDASLYLYHLPLNRLHCTCYKKIKHFTRSYNEFGVGKNFQPGISLSYEQTFHNMQDATRIAYSCL